MLHLVSLANNEELQVSPKDLPRAKLTGIWIEVVDRTKEELQKVAEVSDIHSSGFHNSEKQLHG